MDSSLPIRSGKKKNTSLFACVSRGLLLSVLLLLALLLAAAALAYQSDDPATLVLPLSYAATLFTSFAGGFAASRRRGRQGLICGVLTGAGLLVLFLLGFLIFLGDSEPDMGRLLLSYLLQLALSVLGGVIGGVMPAGGARRVRKPRRR